MSSRALKIILLSAAAVKAQSSTTTASTTAAAATTEEYAFVEVKTAFGESGYCKDWTYLQTGNQTGTTATYDGRKDFNKSPQQECSDRCAASKHTGHNADHFYTRWGKCGCSGASGKCEKVIHYVPTAWKKTVSGSNVTWEVLKGTNGRTGKCADARYLNADDTACTGSECAAVVQKDAAKDARVECSERCAAAYGADKGNAFFLEGEENKCACSAGTCATITENSLDESGYNTWKRVKVSELTKEQKEIHDKKPKFEELKSPQGVNGYCVDWQYIKGSQVSTGETYRPRIASEKSAEHECAERCAAADTSNKNPFAEHFYTRNGQCGCTSGKDKCNKVIENEFTAWERVVAADNKVTYKMLVGTNGRTGKCSDAKYLAANGTSASATENFLAMTGSKDAREECSEKCATVHGEASKAKFFMSEGTKCACSGDACATITENNNMYRSFKTIKGNPKPTTLRTKAPAKSSALSNSVSILVFGLIMGFKAL